ncbi:MAG: PilZ domain-containing protein [Deltaproteobacteria bacterium]
MGEKRKLQRVRRRLRIDLRSGEAKAVGFTADLSPTGMRIQATHPFSPGTRVWGQLTLPDSPQLDFEVEVRWVIKVTGPLSQELKSSMGVAFLGPPPEAYYRFLIEASKR